MILVNDDQDQGFYTPTEKESAERKQADIRKR
jgi:hypothetical protein